jgi:hypothetical protein
MNNIQKLKENTQKTKSKRVTRTPPKNGSMNQVYRYVNVILYLAENAQEFIFVYIPKRNTGDNPHRTTFFLGATPMKCMAKIYVAFIVKMELRIR